MIGVFDSGHGGLTVLRTLLARLPGQPFVYLGDHGNAPYGGRSQEDIYQLTRRSVELLFDQGCRLVVLACNTAAAAGLRRLQQQWLPIAYPDRRVLGVVVPMVEAITRVPWQVQAPASDRSVPAETVGVFATAATVASGAFTREVAIRAPAVRVFQQACPSLVPLIEQGAADDVLRPVVAAYIDALTSTMRRPAPDAVLLGCTHYPLIAHLFAEAFPAGVRILNQPTVVADSLADYLGRHPELAGGAGETRFLTTGDAALVSPLASRFLGRPAVFRRI